MKGFELSEDYEHLWNLIHDGYRVPGWIFYKESEIGEDPHYDLVEIKIPQGGGRYMIGTRGIGYEGFDHTLADFKRSCERIKLRFIVPQPE